jgi:hypothetical protein
MGDGPRTYECCKQNAWTGSRWVARQVPCTLSHRSQDLLTTLAHHDFIIEECVIRVLSRVIGREDIINIDRVGVLRGGDDCFISHVIHIKGEKAFSLVMSSWKLLSLNRSVSCISQVAMRVLTVSTSTLSGVTCWTVIVDKIWPFSLRIP